MGMGELSYDFSEEYNNMRKATQKLRNAVRRVKEIGTLKRLTAAYRKAWERELGLARLIHDRLHKRMPIMSEPCPFGITPKTR